MKIVKAFKANKSEWTQCVIAVLLVVLLMLPLFMLALYSHPSLDDFDTPWKIQVRHSEGNPSWFVKALRFAGYYYMHKQGWYTASFLQALNPYHIIGRWTVPYVAMVVLVLFAASQLCFFRSLMVNVFKCRLWSVSLWFWAASIFFTTQFSNTGVTFYFFTNSSGYFAPWFMFLFGTALFLYALNRKGQRHMVYLVLSCFLLFGACGGQFIVGITTTAVFVAMAVLAFATKYARKWSVFTPAALCVLLIILVIAAPGNNTRHRVGEDGSSYSLILTLWRSVRTSFNVYTEDMPLLWVLGLACLLIFPAVKAAKASGFSFRMPVIPLIITAGIAVLAFGIYYFATMGVDIPEKQISLMNKIVMTMLLFDFLYIMGWLVKKYDFGLEQVATRFAVVLVSVVTLVAALRLYPVIRMISVSATQDFFEGELTEYRARVEYYISALEADTGEDVVCLEGPVPVSPYFQGLGVLDMPSGFDYRVTSGYFGKEIIILEEEAEDAGA